VCLNTRRGSKRDGVQLWKSDLKSKFSLINIFLGCSKSEKVVLKQERMLQNRKRIFYNRKGRSKTGKGRSETGKDVPNQEILSFCSKVCKKCGKKCCLLIIGAKNMYLKEFKVWLIIKTCI
jgi:hypothetical protein